MRIQTATGTLTLAVIVAVSGFTSAQATVPKKAVAQRATQPASVPARPAYSLPTPRPQPTCGPPVNLVSKMLHALHYCPV
jgi:hypothetical protein